MVNETEKSDHKKQTRIEERISIPRPEYEQRHITTLKPVSKWNQQDILMHLQHNRILQPGYGRVQPKKMIKYAQLAKEEWLTDIICPNIREACKLNIAADLVTQFKVSADDLNTKTQEIFSWIEKNKPHFIEEIQKKINIVLLQHRQFIEENVQKAIQEKFPDVDKHSRAYEQIVKALLVIETERERKRITHDVLMNDLKDIYPHLTQDLALEYKSLHPKGTNVDYSFLGAAGSGKSTITHQFISPDEKSDYVILATDDYRGVSFDPSHEKQATDQIFIRTQDSAYSIKELVQKRLEASPNKRSNIILDCVSLEGWHRKLLEGNQKTKSFVACLNDISLVPKRAYSRALDEKSGPADKGRQVHTTSLLEGHASASARLLTSIPPNVRTTLYDTNVPRGNPPVVMGIVDTEQNKSQVEVRLLSKFSEFLAKSNANVDATFTGELYQDKKRAMYQFTFDAQYQANELIKLAKAAPPQKQKNYDILLMDDKKQPYAKIVVDADNKLKLEVLNPQALLNVLNRGNNDNDAKVLKSLAIQIHGENLEVARDNVQKLGKRGAEKEAIEALIPQIEFIPPSVRKAKNKDEYRIRERPRKEHQNTQQREPLRKESLLQSFAATRHAQNTIQIPENENKKAPPPIEDKKHHVPGAGK